MFVRTYAGAIVGIDAVAVTVEVNIAGGGLGMYLVGLPDNAVKESEQRIRAAFENSGERMSGRKVAFTSTLTIYGVSGQKLRFLIRTKGEIVRTTPQFPENVTGFFFNQFIQQIVRIEQEPEKK